MRKILLLLITLIVGLAGQTAMATTKTYVFEGQQTDQTQFTGYFYNEASPSTHYNCTPSPWTYGTTGSLSFTLADGITLTLSSSTNKLQYLADEGLFAKGEATLTVSGGSTYYIYHVRLLDSNGNVIQLDANGMPVNIGGVTLCDYLNTTKSFSQTYTNSIGFKKIQISYATNIADDAYQGSGTENAPYIISSTSDLDLLAMLVNAGNDFSGKFFLQSADITYTHATNWNDANSTENNYTAIGTDDHPFKGTFDGQNFTISGIRIYKGGKDWPDKYQGLFGFVMSGGKVKRVNLADARITGFNEVGGIAGGIFDSTIEDCTVDADVCIHAVQSSTYYHGGIVGINQSPVRRCISRARLTVANAADCHDFGGIAGRSTDYITDCVADGAIIPDVQGRGTIVGYYSYDILTRNYYHSCTVAGVANATGVGKGNSESGTETSDVNGAQALYAITLGTNVTLNRSASATLPGTNNKTYANGADINGQPYAYATATVSLGYTGNVPEGMTPVYTATGGTISGNTLTMPAAPVTISATLVATSYAITLPGETPHGTVTCDKATATMGETVTLTVTPDQGYELGTLTVMAGGTPIETTACENGTYTFTMPNADVTVAVDFISAGLHINATNFPDDNFRNWLLAQDYGSNEWINDDEIAGITSIDVYNMNIANLTGIEHFTALTELYCENNHLTSLDVSHNTALTTLVCDNNHLTSLDVSHNTALIYLYCDSNQIASLDLTHNTSLKQLGCFSNKINSTNMQNLVSSLYDVGLGFLIVINPNDANEQNVITTQVAAAYAKGWLVFDSNGNQYGGSEPRYTFDSETGVLALNWGEFNKDNKWGSDVTASAVKSVTATSEVSFTGDCSDLFRDFSNCESIELGNVNTDSVTNMSYMFCNCKALDSLDLSGWNTGNVTNMGRMFYNCWALDSLDVSGFNTENVTNMRYMFSNCKALDSLDLSGFNTKNVNDMCCMFLICPTLTTLDVSGFNTENVTNMGSMFDGCKNLTSLDVSGFNTGNVEFMCYMFNGCSGLTSLDVSGFNTGNVEDMSYMFCGCSGLTSLDVSGWNTRNVTFMYGMFEDCSGLTSLDVSGWDTRNVANMRSMFNGCSSLTSLDVSGWNTGSVRDMSEMFRDCSGLTSLDLSGWNTGSVTNMCCMFEGCTGLTTIYAGTGWDAWHVPESSGMFAGCQSLVGGMGTVYDADHVDAEYARIDGGPDCPGYFTAAPQGVPGDVNGDGEVTTVDITAIYNYLLNGDETFIDTSDVDGDGFITTVDITVIYNIMLGSKGGISSDN